MRDLGKWPELLVVGEPVTEEQANEILIRTNGWYYLAMGSDYKSWRNRVREILNIPVDHMEHDLVADRLKGLRDFWDWMESIGVVRLEYLYNMRMDPTIWTASRSWCSWDGQIFCSGHNIGKWPSSDEVRDEWREIAAAFPYLDLTAQLIPDPGFHEAPDPPREPAVQWRIKDGKVRTNNKPTKLLLPTIVREKATDLDRIRVAAHQVMVARGLTISN